MNDTDLETWKDEKKEVFDTMCEENIKCDLIICPFLSKRIPKELLTLKKCWIVHPGIKGDRGPSSLDWAIMEKKTNWGVTIIEAVEEMDAGDIWSSVSFDISERIGTDAFRKSSLYRNEVLEAAAMAVQESLKKLLDGSLPEPLNYNKEDVKGVLKPMMRQKDRKITHWNQKASDIALRIRSADSRPGLKEVFTFTSLGNVNGNPQEQEDDTSLDCEKNETVELEAYMFGCHEEYELPKNGKYLPKSIIAQRHGSICIACGDATALWVSHLKKPNSIKLPATMVIPKHIVSTIPEISDNIKTTWRDLYHTVDSLPIMDDISLNIAYVHFDFYNGAMSTDLCIRLRKELEMLNFRKDIDVVVLMGGCDFFSNGIHLNVIEHAEDASQESLNNIIAIDDVVKTIMYMGDKVTISALRGSAGAGGAMMALGSDFVWSHSNVLLNPHYKKMKLYGSEYWTYNLPRKIGHEMAQKVTNEMLTFTGDEAQQIGLVDEIIAPNAMKFEKNLKNYMVQFFRNFDYKDYVEQKLKKVSSVEWREEIKKHREEELEVMKKNFADPAYHEARKRFVYKISCNPCLPKACNP